MLINVQLKSGALVATAISPVPPAAGTDAACGLIAMEPELPACVTITNAAPTVILPQRGEMLTF